MADLRPPTSEPIPPGGEPRPSRLAALGRWLRAAVSGEEVPGVRRAESTPLAIPVSTQRPAGETAEPHHPSVSYERTDTGFRWVVVTAVAVVIFGCVEALVIYVFFEHQKTSQAKAKRSPYPLAAQPSDTLPAEPRLEPLDRTPPGELAALARREADKNRALGRYGTTDEEGFIRVPIERAIESLAGKLPVRETPEGMVRDEGLVDSGEPNSGRLLRGGKP